VLGDAPGRVASPLHLLPDYRCTFYPKGPEPHEPRRLCTFTKPVRQSDCLSVRPHRHTAERHAPDTVRTRHVVMHDRCYEAPVTLCHAARLVMDTTLGRSNYLFGEIDPRWRIQRDIGFST
jgi:hypothetical protein